MEKGLLGWFKWVLRAKPNMCARTVGTNTSRTREQEKHLIVRMQVAIARIMMMVSKMDTHEIDTLEKVMDDTFETPEDNRTTMPIHENIKKEYVYSRYREVLLYVLHEATEEGYAFVVHYTPTGEIYGFKTWQEADGFAKGRKAHVGAFNQLWGE